MYNWLAGRCSKLLLPASINHRKLAMQMSSK